MRNPEKYRSVGLAVIFIFMELAFPTRASPQGAGVTDAVKKIDAVAAHGPFQPTWDSLKENYRVPQWFVGAKFGLFMHWGLYSVPAHHNEWYEKHMYGADRQWHVEHFGPQDKFGYKDFIPMFRAEHFDPLGSLLRSRLWQRVVPAQHVSRG